MNWTHRFAARAMAMERSPVREILKLTRRPDIISFAGGLPAPEFLPAQEARAAADAVLSRPNHEALQYGQSEGVPELRDWVAKKFSRASLKLSHENVLIVSGAQQGLDLLGRVLLDPGDTVLVENPTYLALLAAWAPLGVEFVGVPSDKAGMKVDAARQLLVHRPKLIYSVPNFQNPQGTTLSADRRRDLIDLLRESDLGLVEDDPYGELRYEGESLPSLFELDARACRPNSHEGEAADLGGAMEWAGNVAAVGSFSKILSPGLRVGWIIASADLIEKLVQAKQAADLHTSSLCQLVTMELLRRGTVDALVPKLCHAYRERRDVMLDALERWCSPKICWTKPEGGMFLLARLPAGVDAADLLKLALECQVAFVPGESFHLHGQGKNTFRLNFSHASCSRIEEGIRRLGLALDRLLVSKGNLAPGVPVTL